MQLPRLNPNAPSPLAGVARVQNAGPMLLNGQQAPAALPTWVTGTDRGIYTPDSHSTNQGEITDSYNYDPGAQLSDINAIPITKEAYGRGFRLHGMARRDHLCFVSMDPNENTNAIVPTSLPALNVALRVPDNPLNALDNAQKVLKKWRLMGVTVNLDHNAGKPDWRNRMARTTIKVNGDVHNLPLYWAATPQTKGNGTMEDKFGHHLWLRLTKVKQDSGLLSADSLELSRRAQAANNQETLADHKQNVMQDIDFVELSDDDDEPPASGRNGAQSSASDYCWQFVPYMSPTSSPPVDVCKFTDQGDMFVEGSVYVGTLTRVLTRGGYRTESYGNAARIVSGLRDALGPQTLEYYEQDLVRIEANIRLTSPSF